MHTHHICTNKNTHTCATTFTHRHPYTLVFRDFVMGLLAEQAPPAAAAALPGGQKGPQALLTRIIDALKVRRTRVCVCVCLCVVVFAACECAILSMVSAHTRGSECSCVRVCVCAHEHMQLHVSV
jgi:hypothetical protein